MTAPRVSREVVGGIQRSARSVRVRGCRSRWSDDPGRGRSAARPNPIRHTNHPPLDQEDGPSRSFLGSRRCCRRRQVHVGHGTPHTRCRVEPTLAAASSPCRSHRDGLDRSARTATADLSVRRGGLPRARCGSGRRRGRDGGSRTRCAPGYEPEARDRPDRRDGTTLTGRTANVPPLLRTVSGATVSPWRRRRLCGRGILASATALALLVAGGAVSVVVGDALGIRAQPQARDGRAAARGSRGGTRCPPPPRFTAIDAPDSVRSRRAPDALDAAVAAASTTAGRPPSSSTGRGRRDRRHLQPTGTATALRISCGRPHGGGRAASTSRRAGARGRSVTAHLGETVRSRLPLRMVDLGASASQPDPAQWRRHRLLARLEGVRRCVPARRAYVDQDCSRPGLPSYDTYLRQVLADGYNAIAFPGFVEFATFDGLGVYPDGETTSARARALRAAFGPSGIGRTSSA